MKRTFLAIVARRSSRGLSLLEMMIALAILSLLIMIVMSGIVAYGRAFKSSKNQALIQTQARNLTSRLNYLAATASSLEVFSGGDGLRIVYIRTDDNGARIYRQTEFLYENGDGDDNTIADNRIVERVLGDDGKVNLRLTRLSSVSKLDDTPIFRVNNRAPRQLVEMLVRTGDRTNPSDRESEEIAIADDALSGPGFQGFLVRASLSPSN